jgi:hypothetical protein
MDRVKLSLQAQLIKDHRWARNPMMESGVRTRCMARVPTNLQVEMCFLVLGIMELCTALER